MSEPKYRAAPPYDQGDFCRDVIDIPIMYAGCGVVGIQQSVRFSCCLRAGHKGAHKGSPAANVRVEWDDNKA